MGGELFVDVAGMNSIYNQLQRASDHSSDVLTYVRRHAGMGISAQGWLLALFLRPHEKAYEKMTDAISRIRDLTDSVATQVNIAQVKYSRTDLEAAADLDRGYPGATNSRALASSLTQEKLRLPDGHDSFADTGNPASRLVAPVGPETELWSINPLADLVSPFAWLRQTAIWVFGHDPFEYWAEKFSGNWSSYQEAGAAMRRAGNAAGIIGDNLAAGAVSVPLVWRGHAAENFQEYELTLAAGARSVQEAGSKLGDLYHQASDAVKNIYDVVAGIIMKLLDILLVISIGLGAGAATFYTFAGAVVGFSVALSYSVYASQSYNQVAKIYGDGEAVLKAISASIDAVAASSQTVEISDLESYRHPGN
ncbi:hypothetical protein [Actinoplanes couchii]|uniref:ESX-1 secretion-associated protein EspA/EspE-like domain-containing protein n=1 Tax=Actinoplanes couchii TaxID=403638 RepID=A0ABQ3XLG5_9ACTN|nr:hypothetical protein [Actinoplanes couchii]MDR6318279.1 uncharacterized protein YukE [Actinoplanes couchii]GID59351.1 hypothetical protein Aco03nite_077550 [Actinoplanes couchii]